MQTELERLIDRHGLDRAAAALALTIAKVLRLCGLCVQADLLDRSRHSCEQWCDEGWRFRIAWWILVSPEDFVTQRNMVDGLGAVIKEHCGALSDQLHRIDVCVSLVEGAEIEELVYWARIEHEAGQRVGDE